MPVWANVDEVFNALTEMLFDEEMFYVRGNTNQV